MRCDLENAHTPLENMDEDLKVDNADEHALFENMDEDADLKRLVEQPRHEFVHESSLLAG